MSEEEQNSIIHKINFLEKYPKVIEICFEEFRSKGHGVMICMIGILEGSDEPRLNCYYVPNDKVDDNIMAKIHNDKSIDRDNNLIFYISDTKYNKISTIRIDNLQKYL